MLGLFAAVASGGLCLLLMGVFGDPRTFSIFDFAFLAVVVSLLVGTAVRVGSRRRGGWLYQGLAMFLTYCAIVTCFIPSIHEFAVEEEAPTALPTPSPATGPAETALAWEDGADGTAESPIVWDELDPVERVAYCIALYATAFISPVLILFGVTDDVMNVTWFLIAVVALGIASYRNRRVKITITGPYEASEMGEAASLP